MRRIAVDLPAPFGPRKPVTTPGRTSNDRSLTAWTSPNRLPSPRAVITRITLAARPLLALALALPVPCPRVARHDPTPWPAPGPSTLAVPIWCPTATGGAAGRSWSTAFPSSHVDLDDPTRLDFEYVRWFGDVLDTWAPEGEPLRVVHLGGAGCTLARYVAATRPGSRQVVVDVDAAVLDLARRAFGRAVVAARCGCAWTTPARLSRPAGARLGGRRPRRLRGARRCRRTCHARVPRRGAPRARAGRACTWRTSPTTRTSRSPGPRPPRCSRRSPRSR